MVQRDPKKIMLIEPPFYRLYKETYSLGVYPLALGYLAGAVKKETGWQVQTYNADFYPDEEPTRITYLAGEGYLNYRKNIKDSTGSVWRQVKEAIAGYRPDVVGVSAKSQNFASAAMVARLAKEVNPTATVIVGGPHPSMVGAEVLNTPEIDICVRGEGEATLVELLQALEGDGDLGGLAGIAYRSEGRVVKNEPRRFIADLDFLWFPHRTAPEVLKDYDLHPPAAFRNVFAIRGCPFNCFYCGSRQIWSRRVRYRSAENVIAEIQSLREMGVDWINFSDDTFGVSREYIAKLCRQLAEHCPGLAWSSEIHVNLVQPETVALMKQGGCQQIMLGIESGNNGILKAMRKRTTIERSLAACRIIKRAGINLECFFMVGFPQETEETLQDTVRAMKKCRCDTVAYSIFMPYPGTEIFNFCQELGLIPDGFDVSLYNHQSPANHFCQHIGAERFRELAGQVEEMVDRVNRRKRIGRQLRPATLGRLRELGLRESFRRGTRLLAGG